MVVAAQLWAPISLAQCNCTLYEWAAETSGPNTSVDFPCDVISCGKQAHFAHSLGVLSFVDCPVWIIPWNLQVSVHISVMEKHRLGSF